ncbi:hypothetical protein LOC70_00335 [Rhodopirellula sp. JC737]|nr:hypothetical protein [Rhodopirellula sp. JC737]
MSNSRRKRLSRNGLRQIVGRLPGSLKASLTARHGGILVETAIADRAGVASLCAGFLLAPVVALRA